MFSYLGVDKIFHIKTHRVKQNHKNEVKRKKQMENQVMHMKRAFHISSYTKSLISHQNNRGQYSKRKMNKSCLQSRANRDQR